MANLPKKTLLYNRYWPSYDYENSSHETCLTSETGSVGTFEISIRALKTNSKILKLNRLFSRMNSLKAAPVLMLTVARKIFKHGWFVWFLPTSQQNGSSFYNIRPRIKCLCRAPCTSVFLRSRIDNFNIYFHNFIIVHCRNKLLL